MIEIYRHGNYFSNVFVKSPVFVAHGIWEYLYLHFSSDSDWRCKDVTYYGN